MRNIAKALTTNKPPEGARTLDPVLEGLRGFAARSPLRAQHSLSPPLPVAPLSLPSQPPHFPDASTRHTHHAEDEPSAGFGSPALTLSPPAPNHATAPTAV
eukprot:CAMPEP_0184677406 /NCGR_PEP_ID=MMETSP0312-20130426/6_1 /TAXON_ID=31354 /ORGANISM="Compsopogon coeruleus, Strain SAG 36.94" /LENGTH=100 /DNA_ID=CAMNT_0027125295 /DNA_START=622 /DNA_END=922 /DNA_ORIENTATION=-